MNAASAMGLDQWVVTTLSYTEEGHDWERITNADKCSVSCQQNSPDHSNLKHIIKFFEIIFRCFPAPHMTQMMSVIRIDDIASKVQQYPEWDH